jgi:hypothetical protein
VTEKERKETAARIETRVETAWFLTADGLAAQVGWCKFKPVLKACARLLFSFSA